MVSTIRSFAASPRPRGTFFMAGEIRRRHSLSTDKTSGVRPSTAETRERIRRAALDVFSERGFDGAATRDIALRAGCTQPLLNYHFASKEALWRSSVDLVFGRLDEALAGAAAPLAGSDPAGRARELVRQFV